MPHGSSRHSEVHSFDLMLELLVVNRTSETLQNVLVELSTQALVASDVTSNLGHDSYPGLPRKRVRFAGVKISAEESGKKWTLNKV